MIKKMNYTLEGLNVSMSIELIEEEILNIIKNGLKYLVENKEITKAKSLLIKNLIESEKIKIILEKIGDPIRIERDL